MEGIGPIRQLPCSLCGKPGSSIIMSDRFGSKPCSVIIWHCGNHSEDELEEFKNKRYEEQYSKWYPNEQGVI